MAKLKRAIFLAVAGAALAITGFEWTLRYLHYDEIPIFEISDDIGYLPRPNQAGNFAGEHRWFVNDRGQQNESFVPSMPGGLLLIGDSLTWGGVTGYDHVEKLGPCLQREWPSRRVWSVGAGSWGLLNELAYLKRFPDVAEGVDDVVFISNREDFATRSRTPGELVHPTHRPVWITLYLLEKRLVEPSTAVATASSPNAVASEVFKEWLSWNESFTGKHKPRVTILWYPGKAELEAPAATMALRGEVKAMAERSGVRFGVLDHTAGWSDAFYKDSIHPNAAGNRRLAEIIKVEVQRLWADNPSVSK